MKSLSFLLCMLLCGIAYGHGIKGIPFDAVLPVHADTIAPCPSDTLMFGDGTPNDGKLWNDLLFYDSLTLLRDLCEGPAALSFHWESDCPDDVQIGFTVLLDLNDDGVRETAVTDTMVFNPGEIFLGNALNPGYSGGTPVKFDIRLVPPGQRYRFVVNTLPEGDGFASTLSWTTIDTPAQVQIPQLPHGTHQIIWKITSSCDTPQTCSYTFEIKDTLPPVITCLSNLSANLVNSNGGSNATSHTMSVLDFLHQGTDNCTPNNRMIYGVRKSGSGSGFPINALGNPVTTISFDCLDLSQSPIEIWGRDRAGNESYCTTTVLVQNSHSICEGPANIFLARTEQNIPILGVQWSALIMTSGPFLPGTVIYLSPNSVSVNALPPYTITPFKLTDYLNGVTTFDLLLISRHILGVQLLPSPYAIIAADANKSGTITSFDIIELRKLILGIYTELPQVDSWRFVETNFVFPNMNNPFATAFPEAITITPLSQGAHFFTGIKIGDVNGTADPDNLQIPDDRAPDTLYWEFADRVVKAGEVFTANFSSKKAVAACQFTLENPGLEVLQIIPGAGHSEEDFANFGDKITTAWFRDEPGISTFSVRYRAQRSGLLSEMLQLGTSPTAPVAYLPSTGEKAAHIAIYSEKPVATTVQLLQNTPNPFNRNTTISLYLPNRMETVFRVTDVAGREVVHQAAFYESGWHTITLSAGILPVAGFYYYHLETPMGSFTGKMIRQ